jgi:hypothetical protein
MVRSGSRAEYEAWKRKEIGRVGVLSFPEMEINWSTVAFYLVFQTIDFANWFGSANTPPWFPNSRAALSG